MAIRALKGSYYRYMMIVILFSVLISLLLPIYTFAQAKENKMQRAAYYPNIEALAADDEPGKANGRGEEPAIAAAYVASGVP